MLRLVPSAVPAWWVWPAIQAGAGAAALAAALLVQPAGGEALVLFDAPFGSPCPFRQQTGKPCLHCGMTRSWVWAARGEVARALAYNPAGATLLACLVLGGGVGALRLVTRRPRALEMSDRTLIVLVLGWVTGVYLLPWILRLQGLNPLP